MNKYIGYKNPTAEGMQAQSEFSAAEAGCRVDLRRSRSDWAAVAHQRFSDGMAYWITLLVRVAYKTWA